MDPHPNLPHPIMHIPPVQIVFHPCFSDIPSLVPPLTNTTAGLGMSSRKSTKFRFILSAAFFSVICVNCFINPRIDYIILVFDWHFDLTFR